jgi:CRISPR system Cascade subunit CasB
VDTRAFFDGLRRWAETDTSVVATLRRSLAEEPGSFAPSFPIVEPFVGHLSERARRTVYLAAGLWALAQRRESGAPVPLVEAVRRCAHGRASGSVEKRFVSLLDAEADELVWRLRHLVQLVASDGIPVDWPGLLKDLLLWNSPDRWVQQRWARTFWRQEAPTEPTNAAAASAP